jgi:hypothetical protein
VESVGSGGGVASGGPAGPGLLAWSPSLV